MNRYIELNQEWERLNQEGIQLEADYKDKQKGEIYLKRKMEILNKRDSIKNRLLNIGTVGTVCRVSGKHNRPSIKNPTLMIIERFNLYFVNITEEEVSFLVKMHIKNLVQYKVEFYKPGIILTTN